MNLVVRVLVCSVVLFASSGPAAWAGSKPEDVFGGKVLTSAKMFPTQAKSAQEYITKARKQTVAKFQEDETNHRWRIYYAAFFRAPVNDLELRVRVYDVTDGARKLLATFDEFLSQRGQRAVSSKLDLTRADVGVNRRLKLVIEDFRGKALAEGTVEVFGKVEKHSGQVNFDEED